MSHSALVAQAADSYRQQPNHQQRSHAYEGHKGALPHLGRALSIIWYSTIDGNSFYSGSEQAVGTAGIGRTNLLYWAMVHPIPAVEVKLADRWIFTDQDVRDAEQTSKSNL